MNRKERYDNILSWFQQNTPEAETELIYDNPFQLLVAVILSAQCTDKRVNLTTPQLFQRFPDPESMAASNPEEIFPLIKSISYYGNLSLETFSNHPFIFRFELCIQLPLNEYCFSLFCLGKFLLLFRSSFLL